MKRWKYLILSFFIISKLKFFRGSHIHGFWYCKKKIGVEPSENRLKNASGVHENKNENVFLLMDVNAEMVLIINEKWLQQ